MPLVINTNTSSINSQRHLTLSTGALQKSMEKLSSGYRINRASDDAAGLQLSELLRAQIRGVQKAYDNVQDAINVLNIVDGVYETIGNLTHRIRDLSVQAANDTYASQQRTAMYVEAARLIDEIDRVAAAATYNNQSLMDGSLAQFSVQLGPNSQAVVDDIDLAALAAYNPFADASASQFNDPILNPLGLSYAFNTIDFANHNNARVSVTNSDIALREINNRRGVIGALVNRLESAANNLSLTKENLASTESRIRNVDIASESAMLTRNQILQQASSAMLAQANQSPQLALQLLN